MTEFTTWRSLVDGEEISAIPDSEADHQWNYTAGSGTTVKDTIGSLDAEYTSISWGSSAGAGDTHGLLDGVNDYADLGSSTRSDWAHFIQDGEGTLFAWVNPEDASDIHQIFNSDTSGTNSIMLGIVNDDGFRFQTVADGSGATVNQGDFATENEWQAVAGVADGAEATLYIAEAPDYDLIEMGSESLSTTSNDLDHNVHIGREGSNDRRYWDGGLDLSFKDSEPWSQSELQSFVDDSKDFYE